MKYKSPTSHGSYAMTKVKVFVYGQRRATVDDARDKTNDVRLGKIKRSLPEKFLGSLGGLGGLDPLPQLPLSLQEKTTHFYTVF